jgi:hypothetical protein
VISKTEQSVGDFSVAYQSGREMTVQHFHGMDYQSVKQLCLDLINDNFPKLQQEVMQQATKNVLDLAEQLRLEFEKDKAAISAEKLASPDMQAALNDAVQGAALKGKKSDLSVLAKLVTRRLNARNDDVLDITLEQAIKIVPRLTHAHIKFLAVKQFIANLSLVESAVTYDRLEAFAKPVLDSCSDCVLTNGNLQYLEGIAVLTYNQMFQHGDIWEQKYRSYKSLEVDLQRFKSSVQTRAPSFFALLEIYSKNKFASVTLNGFGQAIALSHLSKFFGDIDFKTWIN